MFKIKSLFIHTLLVKYSNGEQLLLHKKCQFQFFIPNASSPVLFSAQNIQKVTKTSTFFYSKNESKTTLFYQFADQINA